MKQTNDVERSLILRTAQIACAYLRTNKTPLSDVVRLIDRIYIALRTAERSDETPGSQLSASAKVLERIKPAVPIRLSVTSDYIVCLEDGKKVIMLRAYLRRSFGMTPEQYRTRWNLPEDYPMVAPAYSDQRREVLEANRKQARGRRRTLRR